MRDRLVSRGFRCGPVYNGSKQKFGQEYYEITVAAPHSAPSYYLLTKSNRTNKEVLRSKSQLVKYFETPWRHGRQNTAETASIPKGDAEREAELRAWRGDDDEDDDAAQPAPAPAARGVGPRRPRARARPGPMPRTVHRRRPTRVAEVDEESRTPIFRPSRTAARPRPALIAEGEARRPAAAAKDEIRRAAACRGRPGGSALSRRAILGPAVVVALVVDAPSGSYHGPQPGGGRAGPRRGGRARGAGAPLQKRRRSVEEAVETEGRPRRSRMPSSDIHERMGTSFRPKASMREVVTRRTARIR